MLVKIPITLLPKHLVFWGAPYGVTDCEVNNCSVTCEYCLLTHQQVCVQCMHLNCCMCAV